MSVNALRAEDIGLPDFPPADPAVGPVSLFDLSSHHRAREAIDLGLTIDDPGFNMFVVGEDRTGRMTAALAYLEAFAAAKPPPPDWVYLNNFARPHKPVPYRLPTGAGRRLLDRMRSLVPTIRQALKKAFESPDFGNDMQRLSDEIQAGLNQTFSQLQEQARGLGLQLERRQEGIGITPLDANGQPVEPESLGEEQKAQINAAIESLRAPMRAFNMEAAHMATVAGERAEELRRRTADQAIQPALDALEADFGSSAGLRRWLVELRADILDHLSLLLPPPDQMPPMGRRAEDRYAVNLIVDNADLSHGSVVVEPNPTYENLFGHIEYHSINGVLDTNFSMIRSGALHRANGGILVLRADALARQPYAWEALKGALRDREIRIEERPRARSLPMAGAPKPKPMPLDIKVVIVGAPRWYYTFFSVDPDFQVYFKIKADIDPDIETTPENLATYRALIGESARLRADRECTQGAVEALLGESARWAGARDRVSARYELIEDVLSEAGEIADAEGSDRLEADHVARALDDRRQRNARLEDRAQERITRGAMLIDTAGAVVGQINGLTVQSTGDHSFGMPARVTARTFAGDAGVLNIERVVALGGPIQQKGVYVLDGFLRGRFAQRFPLSFSASITFEQSYGGVEGDSASLAELIAILSSLADTPIRQDVAITGSVNQLGSAQAIGGINEKVEGFFRTCLAAGLTGEQGVVLPRANEINLTLRGPVAAAIADGRFHLWSVETVEDAVSILTGLDAGEQDSDGDYPAESLYGRAMAKIAAYDRALAERRGGRAAASHDS